MTQEGPKFTSLKKIDELPMPIFKKCIARDFLSLRDLYNREQARMGKRGFMMMTIDEKESVFNVSYCPIEAVPKSNRMKEIVAKQTDEEVENFMNILAIENGKCVNLRLAKQQK